MENMDKYLKKKTKEISFLELGEKKSLNLKGLQIDNNLPLPILTNRLVENIKRGDINDIKFSNIVDGMIYMIGIDSEFPYNNEYKKLLYETNSDIENYILFKGSKYLRNGNIDDSIACFRALNWLNDKNRDGKYYYGISLEERSKVAYEKNDSKLGSFFLRKSIQIMEELSDIDDSRAYYKLGYYYKYFKEFKKSQVMWKKFIENGGEEELLNEVREQLEFIEIDVKYEEGYTKILEGDPTSGLEILLKLEEKSENWWNLEFMIGLAYRQLGNTEKAILYFENVIKTNPTQIDSFNELGLCYANLNELEKAKDMFSEALKLDPKNHEIICNRGMTNIQINNIDEAKEDIEKAMELNSNDEIVQACYEELKKYL